MKTSHDRLLRLIALFKLFKATLLIAVGVGALKLLHKDVAGAVEHWAELLRLDPNNHYIDIGLEKASNLTPDKIKQLGLGSMIYAGLFLEETLENEEETTPRKELGAQAPVVSGSFDRPRLQRTVESTDFCIA